jgi:hypothetical protein
MESPLSIADLIDRVVHGDPWHGLSLAALVESVTAEGAAAHPVPGAHSIWELVLHMTGWAGEVLQRVHGREAGEPDEGDWPPVGDVDEARWRAAVERLFAAHRALSAATRALEPDSLDRPVTDRRDPALGTGLSRAVTLHGLVHHTVYHSGQIALLKAALRGPA